MPRLEASRVPALTRFVLGCAPIGGLYAPVEEAEAADTLAEAWSRGVRAFDTAPLYGLGLSEERLARFVATRPWREIVLSTKVGRLLAEPADGVGGTEGYFGTPSRVAVVDFSGSGVIPFENSRMGKLSRVAETMIYPSYWPLTMTSNDMRIQRHSHRNMSYFLLLLPHSNLCNQSIVHWIFRPRDMMQQRLRF